MRVECRLFLPYRGQYRFAIVHGVVAISDMEYDYYWNVPRPITTNELLSNTAMYESWKSKIMEEFTKFGNLNTGAFMTWRQQSLYHLTAVSTFETIDFVRVK